VLLVVDDEMFRKMSMMAGSKKNLLEPDASAPAPPSEAPAAEQPAGSGSRAAEPRAAAPGTVVPAGQATRQLRVRVLRAQDLVAKDKGGTSDPLAHLVLGAQKRETKVVPKTLNPEWDEEFMLDFAPGSGQTMDVVLYDHDKGLLSNSKEFLGSATVHLDHLLPDLPFQEWYELEYNAQYQKKKEEVTGKVLLDLFWSDGGEGEGEGEGEGAAERGPVVPFNRERSARAPTAGSLPDLPEESVLEDSRPQTAAALRRVIVTVLKAEGLVAKDKNGFSDPFAQVHLAGQKEQTKHIPKTLNPEWNESFTLNLPAGEDHLEIVLFDHDKGFISNSQEYMGSCKVSLADIAPGTGAQMFWRTLEFDARWQKKEEHICGRVQVEVEVFEELSRPMSRWPCPPPPSPHCVNPRHLAIPP